MVSLEISLVAFVVVVIVAVVFIVVIFIATVLVVVVFAVVDVVGVPIMKSFLIIIINKSLFRLRGWHKQSENPRKKR